MELPWRSLGKCGDTDANKVKCLAWSYWRQSIVSVSLSRIIHHHCVASPWMDKWSPCRRLTHGQHFSWDVSCSSPGKRGQVGWPKTR